MKCLSPPKEAFLVFSRAGELGMGGVVTFFLASSTIDSTILLDFIR